MQHSATVSCRPTGKSVNPDDFFGALKRQQCVKANGPCSEVVFSSPPMESSTPGCLDNSGEELAAVIAHNIHIPSFDLHMTFMLFHAT